MVNFIIWLFYVRWCARLGSKRVIGGFDGAILGVLFSIFGLMIILNSRKLKDTKADIILLEKYKPIG